MKNTTCPECGSENVIIPKVTWYGGLYGQKLIKHRVCEDCKAEFVEGGSVKDLTKAKVKFLSIMGVVTLIIIFILF